MGRIITACVLSITSGIIGIFIAATKVVEYGYGSGPLWYEILDFITSVGFFLPVPIAIFLNLRDWLRASRKHG